MGYRYLKAGMTAPNGVLKAGKVFMEFPYSNCTTMRVGIQTKGGKQVRYIWASGDEAIQNSTTVTYTKNFGSSTTDVIRLRPVKGVYNQIIGVRLESFNGGVVVDSSDLTGLTSQLYLINLPLVTGNIDSSDLTGLVGTLYLRALPLVTGNMDSSDLTGLVGTLLLDDLPLITGNIDSSDLTGLVGTLYLRVLPLVTGNMDSSDLTGLTSQLYLINLPLVTGNIDSSDLTGLTSTLYLQNLPLVTGNMDSSDLTGLTSTLHLNNLPLVTGNMDSSDLTGLVGTLYLQNLPLVTGNIDSSDLTGLTSWLHLINLPLVTGNMDSSDLTGLTSTLYLQNLPLVTFDSIELSDFKSNYVYLNSVASTCNSLTYSGTLPVVSREYFYINLSLGLTQAEVTQLVIDLDSNTTAWSGSKIVWLAGNNSAPDYSNPALNTAISNLNGQGVTVILN